MLKDSDNSYFEAEYFHHTKERLIKFCKKNKHIFLYGAGRYGKACFDFLKEQSIDIEGFLVTDEFDDESSHEYLGKPIFWAKEKIPLMDPKSGIVFSLKKSFQYDIKMNWENVSNVEFFEMDDVFFQSYQLKFMIETFNRINTLAPARKLAESSLVWRKILIIRLDAIGDMIWTTPFFREMKKKFPQSEITLVLRRNISSIVENCPYIDKIIPYDCRLNEGAMSAQMEERAQDFSQKYLIKEQYDVVFLPRYLPNSPYDLLDNVFLALYSGAKYRIARADFIEPLEKRICSDLEKMFSVVAKHNKVEHEVLRILKLMEVCGIKAESDKMALWLKACDETFAKGLLKRTKSRSPLFIAIAPVSNDANRSWDALNYIQLIKLIVNKYGYQVKFVLLGGENAAQISNVIEVAALESYVLNLINKTNLMQAAAVIKHCDIYIGSNTGLLHMASVFEKPVIEISAHLRTGKKTLLPSPERAGAWRVYNKSIQPKGLDDCRDMCLKSYAHCINQITVEEVHEELENMVEELIQQKPVEFSKRRGE